MKILVTGAAGRLGSVVCHHLHRAGHEVVATDKVRETLLPMPVHVADLTEHEAVHPLVKGIEAIAHLGNIPNAFSADARTTYAVNSTINLNVFHAAVEAGVRRIVFASSVQVVSGRRTVNDAARSVLPHLPFDGGLPPCPGSTYGLSKQAGEEALAYHARWNELRAVALRFPWLIDRERLESILARSNATEPSERMRNHLRVDEGFSFLLFADAAALIEAALTRAAPGYRCFMPADRHNQLHGLSPGEIARRYFAGVPHRKDLDEIGGLFDLAEIKEALGWSPAG